MTTITAAPAATTAPPAPADKKPAPLSRFTWERMLRSSELPNLSKLLGLTLATFTDPDLTIPERYTPSLSRLEHDASMSRAAVRRHLDRLEREDWIFRFRPSVEAARKHHARTIYTLTVPAGVSETLAGGLGSHVSQTGGNRGARNPSAGAPGALNQHLPNTTTNTSMGALRTPPAFVVEYHVAPEDWIPNISDDDERRAQRYGVSITEALADFRATIVAPDWVTHKSWDDLFAEWLDRVNGGVVDLDDYIAATNPYGPLPLL